eukprot:7385510-Prymnesium_polylepis.1
MAGKLSFRFDTLAVNEAEVWRCTPPPALHGVPPQLARICRERLGTRAVLDLGEKAQDIEIDDMRETRMERRLLLKTALGALGISLADGQSVLHGLARFARQYETTPTESNDVEDSNCSIRQTILSAAFESIERFADKVDLIVNVVNMEDLSTTHLLSIARGIESVVTNDSDVPVAIRNATACFAVFCVAVA